MCSNIKPHITITLSDQAAHPSTSGNIASASAVPCWTQDSLLGAAIPSTVSLWALLGIVMKGEGNFSWLRCLIISDEVDGDKCQPNILPTYFLYFIDFTVLTAMYGITGWEVKLLDFKACHFDSPSCTKEVRALGLVAQYRLRIFTQWVAG